MTAPYKLSPWTDVVQPHDDIVNGVLDMSAYAADLGGVDRGDRQVPFIYRDAHEFFRTTYLTRNLRRLLAEVMGAIAGGAGDRVIQLRTPFGGGKTHGLLALYHLMRDREAIDPAVEGIPNPGSGKVVVLSGVDLDPITPREVDGVRLHTLWGELAYRLGGRSAYETIRQHDEEGAAPGGDTLRALIGGTPTLILLDEVLVYVESAGGTQGADHPRRRQALVFLQKLTEVARGLPHAAMVYSLQASTHEAAGDEVLLTELEKLVTRVDAKREPVADDELTRVVQRRLFPEFGTRPEHRQVAQEVAREYALAYRRMREAYGQTTADRRAAGAEAERFERRVAESYPFHPELLDLMYHRWGSLPSYQRTRGALQFLACVVHALWHGERPRQPLIGPGDAPLEDERVRGAFFSQVGQPREQYTSVLSADVVGRGARAHGVDDRLAADSPRYKELMVGTKAATAVMLYSFGARENEEPGVVEADLVQALAAPELDRNVLAAALGDLREQLLYLHYTGRRYRFEPKANLNLLIAEEMKKVESEEVLGRIRAQLAQALQPAGDAAILWPSDSGSIPDHEPVFRIVYLHPDLAELDKTSLHRTVARLVNEHGPGRRDFKNALAFAVPGRTNLDRARSAARALLALEALESSVHSKRITVEDEQKDDLITRRRAAAAELAAAVDGIYQHVLIPVADRQGDEPFVLDSIDLRAQLAAGRHLHSRLHDGLRKHVFDTITPVRLMTLIKLGIDRSFVACDVLPAWFFTYLDFPKLTDARPLREAISAGTADTFAYVAAADVVDGELRPSRPDLVRFGTRTAVDEVDLGSGCFLAAPELAHQLLAAHQPAGAGAAPQPEPAAGGTTTTQGDGRGEEAAEEAGATVYRLSAELDAAQLFRVLPALQHLADRASRLRVLLDLEAESAEPFERAWLRNAVEEHFDEAGVERR